VIAALVVFGYAVVVAWLLPSVLAPLTESGSGARLGIAVWLTGMASVLISAGVAVALLIRSAVSGWSRFAVALCRSVAGASCTPVVYRSALYELGLAAAALVATFGGLMLTWRYGRRVQQARRSTRAHSEAARITGRLDTSGAGVVVLDATRPAAYCVPGRPGTIVVTSAALAMLAPSQLGAVLAHERAHLSGRHHLLTGLTRCLAAVFPAVPLFRRGSSEVSRLAEMCADDAAARRAGRRPLIEALLAIGTGAAIPAASLPGASLPGAGLPGAGLAAASYAVAARVHRLLDPPRRARRIRLALLLAAVLTVLPVVSVLVFSLASAA
jgi:Zn-dependent protease with chaperone function